MLNLPNRITLARICMVPLFVLLMFWNFPGHDIWAAVVFIVAAATDGIDGHIARSRHLITNLGKFLDPLADKILVSAALISFVGLHRAPAWVVILIIFREFAITGFRSIAVQAGVVLAASPLGKIKTVTQMIACVLLLICQSPAMGNLLISPRFLWVASQIMLYVALFFTLYSGWDYISRNKKVLKG